MNSSSTRPRRWRSSWRAAAPAGVVAFVIVLTGCLGGTTTSSSTASTAPTLPPPTTVDPGPGFTIPPPPTAAASWAVDTATCADPEAANTEITETLTIGTAAPQSGGLISAIYAPVLAGFRAYVDQANAQRLLGDVELKLVIADDEGKPELTPVAVGGLLAADADVISAVPGSANNLAIRESLNVNCVPQLMALASTPRLGDVRNFPWTMGGVVTETVETTVYANAIVRSIGEDATVALLVSNDDAGTSYAGAFLRSAADTRLSIVAQQTVEPDVIDAPVAQILAIAIKVPRAIVASVSGAACATFLTELAKVRTALPGWEPDVYLSSACADASVLRLAGAAANGVMSSANLVDDDPTFVETMRASGLSSGYGRAAEGWTAAEITVAILIQAQRSEAGLTRASIIAAARNLSVVPTLARPGVEYITNGVFDAFPVESLQVVRYVSASQTFTDIGRLVVQFES